MEPVVILLFAAIIVGTFVIFYFSPKYAPKIIAAATGPYDLNQTSSPTIVTWDTAKTFYTEPNSSFSAFVFLSQLNRTGAYAPCGNNANQVSCEDGTVAPCPCDISTGDCSECYQAGYSRVFDVCGILQLNILVAPDSSRQGKAMAQLTVKTEGAPQNTGGGTPSSSSQKYIETLMLPEIPLQKWTYITVAREGRRFDVYYNNTIVLSKKTMYIPIADTMNASPAGITSGSPGLSGQIAVANLYNYRLSSKDVAAKYTQYADSRGRPYMNVVGNPMTLADAGGIIPAYASSVSTSLLGFVPSFNLCPGGQCFNPPTIQPATPLDNWGVTYQ
jgi:hypothetical protein